MSKNYFRAGFVYPLKDPAMFADDYGTGYAFAYIPSDAEPSPQCWLHDMWIVNEAGEHHPGKDVCPVPVRRDAVHITKGVPFEGMTRPWQVRVGPAWR